MTDGRIERWVRGPHVRLDLRSSVAVSASSSPAVKRRAVDAVQSGGSRGALVQGLLRLPFAHLPARLAARLPLVRLTSDAGLALPADRALAVLAHAEEVLDGRVTDVVWLLPPASDGERASALLLAGSTPIGHLRITDLAPVDRPDPQSSRGARTGVEWPMMLDVWEIDGMVAELTTAIDLGSTTPTPLTLSELEDLIADLRDALGPAPDGLVAAHGDLTPWNLRTATDGRRVLFDWEHRAYGPDGIDLVRFLVAGGEGAERFGELSPERRRELRGGVDYLLALADARDASRRAEQASEWKLADVAAERTELLAMRDLADEVS